MEISESQFMGTVRAIAPLLFKDTNPDSDAARKAIVDRQRAAFEQQGFVIVADAPLNTPPA